MSEQSRIKVLIGPSTFAAQDKRPLEYLLREGIEIVENPYKRRLTKKEVISLLSNNVEGLIAGLEPLDRDVLKCSKLRVISRSGVGMSNVDLAAAEEFEIKVYNTPDAPTVAVAEITIAAMLDLCRSISDMNSEMHNGKWDKNIGVQLSGKCVLIVGFGRIGQKVASFLKPFNVKLLVSDPNINKVEEGINLLGLKDALPKADIITIHSSGDSEIIGENEFALMKPGVFLLNSARGAMVNETSLMKAIDDGIVRKAWMDVFIEEPYFGKLKDYSQVLLTPHTGSYTSECRSVMEMQAALNLIKGLKDS